MLAACAPVGSRTTRTDAPWYRTVVETTQSDLERVSKFYDRLTTLKGNELTRELEIAREAFENDKSHLNRLQLAMLLSFPGTSFRDDNAALALLSPYVRDKGQENASLRPLAVWITADLLELRRADDALQQQAAKTKEEQSRADALQQKAETLLHKADALQQKLDAILDMEMKMIEREQNVPKKK
jgi:hypothetical protein